MTEHNSFVLPGLLNRRAQLAGEIQATRNTLTRMMHALDALDTTIRLFDPSHTISTLPVKRVRTVRASLGGDTATLVLDCLRDAGRAVTTREVVDYILNKRGIVDADIRLDRLARNRAYGSLRNYVTQGMVRPATGAEGAQVWVLI